MRQKHRAPMRTLLSAAAAAGLLASAAGGQTTYEWNGDASAWTAASNWTPAGGPPTVADVAKFVATPNPVMNPVLNSAATVKQTMYGGSHTASVTVSGSGSLTTGIHNGYEFGTGVVLGTTGLTAWAGSGDLAFNLGNGSATSLSINGMSSPYGMMALSADSRLILTGNTIAALNNTPVISNAGTGTTSTPPSYVRSGALVLDNSAGNPVGQRLTMSNTISLFGGGSALELRGAAAGTTFSGITSGVLAQGGDGYIRTVQNGSGAMSVAFASISRGGVGRHLLYFENIGTGFVGAVGKPVITSASATGVNLVNNGVISGSASLNTPWVMVTNRASDTPAATVTGRWANYSGGIVASTPTVYTGDFGAAPANSNILYAPNAAGTVALTSSVSPASVVFEPAVAGATLNLGSNKLNTFGIAHSGAHDLTITGGSLVDDGATAAARNVIVLNPASVLSTDSNLGNTAGSSILVGGRGTLALTGTSNQLSGVPIVYLNGGALRATTSNFLAASTGINFRGGVLEYDVSGGNATAAQTLGSGAGTVGWSGNSAGFSGDKTTTDVGGGGFSAYSTSPGNTLTVNLQGGATLNWNDIYFVSAFYALKFGSPRSNATVLFQNALTLDAVAAGTFGSRLIEVTRGAGNAADKTIMNGVISGTAATSLVKAGFGVLELAAANTYAGNTVVRAGTLQAGAANTFAAGSAHIVHAGATLDLKGFNQIVASIAGEGAAVVSATLNTNGDNSSTTFTGPITGSGTLVKAGTGTLSVTNLRTGGLNVGSGVVKAISSGGAASGTSKVTTLSVGGSSKLDLTDNKLITADAIGTFSGGVYTGVTRLIQTGRNLGAWNGPGIMTSLPAAASPSTLTSIGVATGEQAKGISGPTTASWGGQTVAATDTLVMYTYTGDANLSGKIDADDYFQIDSNYNKSGSAFGWNKGDFNYDGLINGDDYLLIDSSFSGQGSPFVTADPGVTGVQAVPEPAGISVFAAAGAGLLARHRRRR